MRRRLWHMTEPGCRPVKPLSERDLEASLERARMLKEITTVHACCGGGGGLRLRSSTCAQ